jgi:hypothetical protein
MRAKEMAKQASVTDVCRNCNWGRAYASDVADLLADRAATKALVEAAIAFGKADVRLDASHAGDEPDLVDEHVSTYEALKGLCRELYEASKTKSEEEQG